MRAAHPCAVHCPQPANKKINVQFWIRHLKFPILSAPLRQARGCQGRSFPSVRADGGACGAAGAVGVPLVLEESWLQFPDDSIPLTSVMC